ncbi:hypothetical protein A3A93_03050 [Candidatus Roizmanbacteria bacterium RIFCSPLOWO2_01_FULL_38_12]|uniref:Ribulose-phosphate 3-epimerase n=1 Tax=Candidatus Roizmanbacteria bacterium RIFCSPLOWO2_01_FULL_38_12 TaxID=1802061 RepID=A0A1F7IZI7_9BACT|nr:MAG: hypothetical protein A2861_02805 [Candidatus Roizmanbacteria bacterium RIFCSPHIGHO2_01_FULL_38_15]OGK35364.1 MAG: hypothetical protein A3F59_06160 [Candidatus Roizmanbacteria bacterium RIFCSPHIGHO2_12_FULL_38_13]OGK48776.1 MAG: hypothetical protein A3A93_03050 [Candidatus Roizmanbacteria bacterium RIFCSPLOWO2_01_FULL_38_12]
MQIIPTLLTTTVEEFIEQMNVFQKYFDRIQLDIADGKLVSNVTTHIEEIESLILDKKVDISSKVSFDFHLMVSDYAAELQKIIKLNQIGLNIKTILINASLHPDIEAMIDLHEFSIGLDVFPEVQIDDLALEYNLTKIPSIQIMTVNPGFQGSPFLPNMLMKIEQLSKNDYRGEIMIDGGVNENTLPIINSKEYRPDLLCVGSYLTKAGEKLEERIALLNKQ